ncbi:MAG: hypothetical protein WBC22_17290 [Sedimentisphaerales bacterium]
MHYEQSKPDIKNDLIYSLESGHHRKSVLSFIRGNIVDVSNRLLGKANINISTLYEDDISREITNLLNDKLRELSGYLFRFEAKEGPDILIFASPYKAFSEPLFFIEAKRLPPTSSRDYVNSGIGRFKNKEHGKNHDIAAMLGYVQKEDFNYWYGKVNSWIDDLIANPNDFIGWSEQDKITIIQVSEFGEYKSTHSRKKINTITLYHFWINLCK